MRHRWLRHGSLALAAFAALTACERHISTIARGSPDRMRRDGLWQQTLSRDGKSFVLGRMRVCVDAATDSRMTMIGHAIGQNRCSHAVVRQSNGTWRFRSVCRLARGGVVDSTGSVWSDYASSYRMHAESVVRGAMLPSLDGRHVTDVSAKYVGACPSDMTPGEVILGPGLRIDLNRLPIASAAAAFG